VIADIIVVASVVLSAAFTVAWILRPDLRAWVERPKYQFHDSVRRYDRGSRPSGETKEHLP